MKTKCLLIDAHPMEGGLSSALLASYGEGAGTAGQEVRRLVLREMVFDPILRERGQTLEADLVSAQEAIRWAEHLAFAFPTWWTNLPALLKGFLDRAFLSGFAFRYREDSPLPEKLLGGKSARLLVTMDAPEWWNTMATGRPQTRALRDGTLYFCGVRPVRVTVCDRVKSSTPDRRAAWMAQARRLGEKDARG